MAYDPRKIVAFGIVGVLIATFIILAVQVAPLLKPGPTERTGVLLLKITDGPPFTKPTSLNITIDSIMMHREGDANETWITFPLNGNKIYDLVKLENITAIIGSREIPVGNYTMIKMHITRAVADLREERGVELNVPSDYIKIPVRFTVKENRTSVVLLDITYDSVAISASHNLRPTIHPTVEQTGVVAEQTGVLVLMVTDAPPFTKPTSLNITIDSIMVHRGGNGNETWITFRLAGNKTYDLVRLENVTDLLGANKLPAGNYTMIKMHVAEAAAIISGSRVELEVPSDDIKIPVRFSIKNDGTTIILLDITYDSAAISTSNNLRPTIHPIIKQQP